MGPEDPGARAREGFLALADWLVGEARAGERIGAYLRGEGSDFVRLSRGQVRQAGHVTERELSLTLAAAGREASARLDLGGDPAEDRARVAAALADLRETLPHLPEDPFLHHPATVEDTEDLGSEAAIDSEACLAALLAASRGIDLVGIWAAGPVYAGFASSSGQRNWHQRQGFHLDWSGHLPDGQAVKASYGGERWDGEALRARVERMREHLALLARGPVTLDPGRYRVYLAPAALREVLGVLAWGGFSLHAWRTRQTPLLRLLEGERRLHPAITLTEDNAARLAPPFTREGFLTPPVVPLVTAGAAGEALAAARTAREYGVPVNAADETPRALALAPGDLASADALAALGDGLYLGNLWYCNFSDRNDCRVTGMTRYACFRVEGGRLAAPFAPMRFDEGLYRMLGDRLVALTRERELLPDDSTYEGRTTASMCLPGALVEDFTLTL